MISCIIRVCVRARDCEYQRLTGGPSEMCEVVGVVGIAVDVVDDVFATNTTPHYLHISVSA